MMKKRIILTAFIAVVCTIAFGATLQRTILSHKGSLTQYDANHWQDAITDAVDGDTVYFTAGNFAGELVINKVITVIGAGVSETDAFYKDTDMANAYTGCATSGESTLIEGGIIIAIPGSVTLTSTLIENIRLSGTSITITEPVTNLRIKRCQVSMVYENWWYGGELGASATVTNMTLEDCYFYNVNLKNFVNPDIHNCYFDGLKPGDDPTPEGTEFLNCTIMEIWNTSNCNFINCIVRFATGSYNTCTNCIYEGGDHNTNVNSWEIGGGNTFSKSQLESAGYMGIDGTVVGPLGGPSPFTLIPSQPYISSSTLTYVKSTKKLNVNLTVKKGQ